MNHRSRIVGVTAVGLMAAAVSRAAAFQVIVVFVLLIASFVALARLQSRSRSKSDTDLERYVPFLAGAWLMLLVLPAHSFVQRRGAAVTSELGVEPLIELVYFTAAGALALTVIRRVQHDLDSARPPGGLLVLPIWVGATGIWGSSGPYSIARAFQYVVFWLLAWATMSVAVHRPEHLDDLLSLVVRWFIRIAFALILVGVVLGPIRVPTGVENADRFTWIAAHPNASGLIMAMATVLLAAAPQRVTRLAPVPRLAAGAVFVIALYDNHSRTSWLCLVLGLVFVYITAGRHRPRVWAIGGPFLALGVAIVVSFRWESVWEYVLRDSDSSSLATGHGRRELWTIGARSLDTTFDWLFGHGYGITRTLFLEEASWPASSAHNSVLAMLVGTGIVGVVVLLGTVGTVVWSIVRSRLMADYDLGRAVAAAVLLLILNAAASDVLAEPSFGVGFLYLAGATARGWLVGRDRRTSGADTSHDRVSPFSVDLQPERSPGVDGENEPSPEDATSFGARSTADQ